MSSKNTNENQPEIIPAIMPVDRADLEEQVSLVRELVPLVQIDVMDGEFVSSRSWPYWHGGYADDFAKLLHEEEGLPYWQELDYEVDLMVANPEQAIDDWIIAGAKRIVFHLESTKNPQALLENFRKRFPKEDAGSPLYVEIGTALNVDTPTESLFPLIESEVGPDFIQCMGIAKIGFQGQPFDDRVLEKISTLRKRYPDLIISNDGGVNLDTASELVRAGVNRLVSGSAIFESDNIVEAIEGLRNSA